MQTTATEYPWVVLVEDDESLEGELAYALERALPAVKVRRTPDADVALAMLRDSRSRLLITEAQSSSVDGLTLAACARRKRPLLPLIFLADTQTGDALSPVSGFDRSHLVDKPPELGQFVDLVARLIEPPVGFCGELSTSGLMELVQLVVMTTPTGALYVETDVHAGSIWFEEGAVVHAACEHDRGSAAFQRMLRWQSGHFKLDPRACAPQRTIQCGTTELLLEGARILDEENARISTVVAKPEGRAIDHFERGLEAVQRKEYGDALMAWELAAQLEPGNRLYQHNLTRLRHVIKLNVQQGIRLQGGDE